MKYIILLFCFIFTITVKSQDLEKIKQQNTFFILLNKNDKLSGYGCASGGDNPGCMYTFLKENKELFEYSFSYHAYKDIDDYYNKINRTSLFRLNKSFLRKNKDIIITREFMEEMGKRVMLDLLYSDSTNKTIFLINTADNKNGTILLREVEIDYTADE